MKKYLIKIELFFALLILVLSGCKKQLDINDNPNQATDSNVPYRALFTGTLEYAAEIQAGGLTYLDRWMGYWAIPGDYAPDQSETSYNEPSTFTNGTWANRYQELYNLYQVKTKALAANDSVIAGCAMILSAKYFQDLVDLFGNVPYKGCFQSYKNAQPTYDDAKAIYTDLQKVLDTAINYLGQTLGNSAKAGFVSADIATAGNITKWKKFANTLKLRLCIRQSQVSGYSPTTEIAKIVANGGVLGAGESFSVNPGYTNLDNKQSPYYGNWGWTPIGNDASATTRANSYIVNLMTNGSPNNDWDYRVFYLFRPISSYNVVGCTYGAPSSANPTGSYCSKVGNGLCASATQNAWIYPSFESMFLQAEAIARGWMSGNAQTAYKAAVTESIKWVGAVDGGQFGYIANGFSSADDYAAYYLDATQGGGPNSDFSYAGTTVASQVKFIALQKYFALTGIDPLEAWTDLNRLHMMPDNGYISVNTAKVSNTLPVRMQYPNSEYQTNGANVNAQGSINIFSTKLFWQP